MSVKIMARKVQISHVINKYSIIKELAIWGKKKHKSNFTHRKQCITRLLRLLVKSIEWWKEVQATWSIRMPLGDEPGVASNHVDACPDVLDAAADRFWRFDVNWHDSAKSECASVSARNKLSAKKKEKKKINFTLIFSAICHKMKEEVKI